jgi:hypothetical protein
MDLQGLPRRCASRHVNPGPDTHDDARVGRSVTANDRNARMSAYSASPGRPCVHTSWGRSFLAVARARHAGECEADEEGYCGTCETAVLDGVPDHRDVVLTKAERAAGRTIMSCVSRACGRKLVLDL